MISTKDYTKFMNELTEINKLNTVYHAHLHAHKVDESLSDISYDLLVNVFNDSKFEEKLKIHQLETLDSVTNIVILKDFDKIVLDSLSNDEKLNIILTELDEYAGKGIIDIKNKNLKKYIESLKLYVKKSNIQKFNTIVSKYSKYTKYENFYKILLDIMKNNKDVA
jgi:hypothetical protein